MEYVGLLFSYWVIDWFHLHGVLFKQGRSINRAFQRIACFKGDTCFTTFTVIHILLLLFFFLRKTYMILLHFCWEFINVCDSICKQWMPEQLQWRCFNVFTVNFEQISQIVLAFPLGIIHLVRAQKLPKKLTFLPPYTQTYCAYQRVKNVSFLESFTYVLNK